MYPHPSYLPSSFQALTSLILAHNSFRNFERILTLINKRCEPLVIAASRVHIGIVSIKYMHASIVTSKIYYSSYATCCSINLWYLQICRLGCLHTECRGMLIRIGVQAVNSFIKTNTNFIGRKPSHYKTK